MTVHLIKLSVGPDNLKELQDWQNKRLKDMRLLKQTPELIHITRHMPKRSEEILAGGSIYWVIKGFIVARQKLIELRPVLNNDIAHCGLVLNPEMIAVKMTPRRPFQGWRYLEPADAPPDIKTGSGISEMPIKMQQELAELGLL